MFSSERKSQRSSLKCTAKNTSTKHLSTAIGASVRFKESQKAEQEVRQFQEESGRKEANNAAAPYQGWNLAKDMNYLNSIYSHILILTSSHIHTHPGSNYQIAKLSTQIENVIHQNLQLKEQIDAKYKSNMNLQQISDHLGVSPKEIVKGPLQDFIANYEDKESKSKQLSLQVAELQRQQQSKKGASGSKISEKEARCKALRRIVQKQKNRIAKLELEERSLMKRLYNTQKQLLKNQHSSSLIKLKLTEAQDHQQKRARAKTRDSHAGKENQPSANKEKRSMKIEQIEKLRPLHGHL